MGKYAGELQIAERAREEQQRMSSRVDEVAKEIALDCSGFESIDPGAESLRTPTRSTHADWLKPQQAASSIAGTPLFHSPCGASGLGRGEGTTRNVEQNN